MKKALALILTLCMLVGMPLCMEVAATGDPNTVPTQQTARLVQALALADGRVQLYFNCQITINPAPAAYIALVDGRGLCAQIDPVNGTRGSGPNVSLWDAVIGSDLPFLWFPRRHVTIIPPAIPFPKFWRWPKKPGLTP